MPRPGALVMHPAMLGRVRGVAETAQTASCQLVRPASGLGQFNPETGQHDTAEPDLLWEGDCRVQPRSRSEAETSDIAGRDLTLVGYQVTVPIAAPAVEPGVRVNVLACTDPQLVGKTLTVSETAFGDNQAERRLLCTLDIEAP